MRFMVIVKADKNTEAGALPDERMLAAMGKFNEELVNAGVMLAGEGLHPSAKGARVTFSGTRRSVINGPFTDTRGLVAGFWLWQVKSLDEAIEWVKRCPNPTGEESEIEIRQVFEADDFGAEFTPELREQEQRQRAQMAASQMDSGMIGNTNAVANIAVKDIDVARKFYAGTLGLKQVGAEGEEVIVFRSGHSTFNVYRSEYAGSNKATAVTWAVGFDLENLVRELKAKGVSFEHYDMPGMTRDDAIHVAGDMKVAWFKDPDGNILNLVNR